MAMEAMQHGAEDAMQGGDQMEDMGGPAPLTVLQASRRGVAVVVLPLDTHSPANNTRKPCVRLVHAIAVALLYSPVVDTHRHCLCHTHQLLHVLPHTIPPACRRMVCPLLTSRS